VPPWTWTRPSSRSVYAAQLTQSDSASLFLYDEARNRSEVCASHNTPEDYLKAIESHQPGGATEATQEPTFGLSLVAKVVRERAPVQIPERRQTRTNPTETSICDGDIGRYSGSPSPWVARCGRLVRAPEAGR